MRLPSLLKRGISPDSRINVAPPPLDDIQYKPGSVLYATPRITSPVPRRKTICLPSGENEGE
jgi:hypothetical protein